MEWTFDREKTAEGYLTIAEYLMNSEEKDVFMALHCYEKAAQYGNAKAGIFLSDYYREKGEYEKELKWLVEIDKNGNELPAKNTFRLGQYYQYGWESARVDSGKAKELYEKASAQGNKSAAAMLRFWPIHKLMCAFRMVYNEK